MVAIGSSLAKRKLPCILFHDIVDSFLMLDIYDKKDNRQDLCLNINGSGTTNILQPVCQVSFSAVLFTYMFISGTHGCCITNIGIKTVKLLKKVSEIAEY